MTPEPRESRKPEPAKKSPDERTRLPRLDTPADVRRRPLVRRRTDTDRFGRFAEQFARYMGTARFLIWMTAFVVIWIGWNLVAPGDWRFDDYPFIFLTLMLSLQASYAAPLILLAQNRQELRDRVVAEQDRQQNTRAHADMEFLAREVAALRMTLGEVATRDFLRSELRNLMSDLTADLDERGLDDLGADTAAEAATEAGPDTGVKTGADTGADTRADSGRGNEADHADHPSDGPR